MASRCERPQCCCGNQVNVSPCASFRPGLVPPTEPVEPEVSCFEKLPALDRLVLSTYSQNMNRHSHRCQCSSRECRPALALPRKPQEWRQAAAVQTVAEAMRCPKLRTLKRHLCDGLQSMDRGPPPPPGVFGAIHRKKREGPKACTRKIPKNTVDEKRCSRGVSRDP